MNNENIIDVSVIITIYNGEKWIDRCFEAISSQTAIGNINFEICVCNDASIDCTSTLLEAWKHKFAEQNINLSIFVNKNNKPNGVGYGKNQAVRISRGQYLCFQDIDDVMLPNRILSQYIAAKQMPDNVLIGSMFRREPKNSTLRYTRWANTLSQTQCNLQIYTSHGPTVLMPTWFMHKNVFLRVQKFSETGTGTPEDLIFFYHHLDRGGTIFRVDEELLVYFYHEEATTFTIKEDTIWQLRIKRLEREVLPKWTSFTIWNSGKQGRRFYKSLSVENKGKVAALCDVDEKKIGKAYVPFDEKTRSAGKEISIVHFKDAQLPFVICVKLDMTDGQFENNLSSLMLEEGRACRELNCDSIVSNNPYPSENPEEDEEEEDEKENDRKP